LITFLVGTSLAVPNEFATEGKIMRDAHQTYHASRLLFLLALVLTLALIASDAKGDQALPPQGLVAVDSAVSMPEFSLPGLDGATVNSAGLQGKVVVVRFWATW
jgi:cytochrome oxidase Cu insertion factor (SCO1/SenC/PrrC family)